MFYSRFLESVERWPSATAIEIQRQPGADTIHSVASSVTTAPDGHVIESYTYAQLRRVAEAVAQWLIARGIVRDANGEGARCAILAANSPRWVATQLGIIASGNTAVPLDTAFTPYQVTKLLKDCGATILFTDKRSLANAREAVTGTSVRLAMIDEPDDDLPTVEQMIEQASPEFVPREFTPEDVACILYTSGTTSDPKGVMMTHSNLVGEMDAVYRFVKLGPGDALLGVLPLFHALAQMANILLPLAAGSRVVFLDALNTSELMVALRDRGITIFCCVPQFFYLIHERIFGEVSKKGRLAEKVFRAMLAASKAGRTVGVNLGKVFFAKVHSMLGPQIRFFVTGGSRFDSKIGWDFHSLGFDILQAYGLTESTGGSFCTPLNDNVIGSIGRPLPGVEAKLGDTKTDENGHLVGEILLRGQIVMKGYYHRPDATEQVLKDGWFHTGDLAYTDKNGNYFITGRAKDIIVLSSGKNIYPEEIESYYLRSPWIKELCVIGLESKPGEPLSERLHGVIVPNFEVLRQHHIVNTREVIRYDVESISAELPSTKRILSFDIWQEDLPRTTTRKLRRFEIEKKVKELHARGAADEVATPARKLTDEERQWLENDDVQQALAIIRNPAKKQDAEIHPGDNLELDLGLDSMERVELLVELAHRMGAEVDDSAASEVYTVRELIDLVRANMGKGTTQGAGWENVFAQEATDPEVRAIAKPRPFSAVFWWVVGFFVRLLARIFFRLKVEGMENLPKGTPFVIASNHASYLDGPVLTATLPWHAFHRVFFVGTSDIFGSGLMRKFASFIRLMPVDPDSNLVPAMRAGAYGLQKNKVLVLYPEGERSIEGDPKRFKKGAAILARHLGLPIVPVAQYGFHEAWPRGKRFQKFSKLRIRVGKPIYPDPAERAERSYDHLTEQLRERVLKMWHELRAEETGVESEIPAGVR